MSKTSPDLGRPYRISDEVIKSLTKRFKRRKRESIDAFLRRIHGLEPKIKRKPKQRKLLEAYAVRIKGGTKIFMHRSEAKGTAIMQAALKGKKRPMNIIKLKEVI